MSINISKSKTKRFLENWSNPEFNLQYRLGIFAILFLFCHALILTLSPAVRFRSWQVDYLWSHWIGFFIWLISFLLFNKYSSDHLKRHDQFIIPVVGLLCGWGVLTVWRINAFFGFRQSIWLLVCVFLGNLLFARQYTVLVIRKYKYLLLISGLLLAALTFFFGTYPGGIGPRLWLGAHGVFFQPSEFLKLLLIMYLAAYFSEKAYPHIRIKYALFPTVILVLSSLFILVGQRDMGTALIFIVIYIFMIFIAFGRKQIFGVGLIIIFLAAIVGYIFIDLIRIRFLAWVLPWLDPQAGAYQIVQSLIAIAAGGLFGTGIGLGSPRVVPIAHSDFIYTSIVEETGLMGAIGILLLFALLFFRGLIISINAPNKYYRFLSAGISTFILFQAILIMGGNIRLLPITGVTLPFVSYGGSSLIVSVICSYLLLVISNNRKNQLSKDVNLQAYQIISLIFSIGIILVALVAGWWAIIRSYDLQHRADNTRRLSVIQFVKRGTIYDRSNQKLAESVGEVGSLQRVYPYPPLTNTIGYIHRRYGLSGLESSLDEYLSGERGYPASSLWFHSLLYDQPPPGIDVRLTINLQIQKIVDELFNGKKGSAVVMNPKTGEILAIASHPHFDANQLDELWQEWRMDENAPFLNRAVQGVYPIGEVITPFLLSEEIISDLKEKEPFIGISLFSHGMHLQCAIEFLENTSWRNALMNGCPSILIKLLGHDDSGMISRALNDFNLLMTPAIGLPARSNTPNQTINQPWIKLLHGENSIRVNPLQITAAASAFSNQGLRPTVNMLHSVNTATQGWIVVTDTDQQQIISAERADAIASSMASSEISGWEMSATSQDAIGTYSWYIAGTPPNWEGSPIIMVVVVENENAEWLRRAGREIYRAITR